MSGNVDGIGVYINCYAPWPALTVIVVPDCVIKLLKETLEVSVHGFLYSTVNVFVDSFVKEEEPFGSKYFSHLVSCVALTVTVCVSPAIVLSVLYSMAKVYASVVVIGVTEPGNSEYSAINVNSQKDGTTVNAFAFSTVSTGSPI
jgi:hypothetical protein